MKRLFFILLFLPFVTHAQTPQMRVFFVDSAGYNQVASWLLPQVAISGYAKNLIYFGSTSQYVRGDGSLASLPAQTGVAIPTLSKSANYTIVSGDFGNATVLYLSANCTSGSITETLPSASSFPGFTVFITKSDASTNTCTISGVSYDNILSAQNWTKQLYSTGSVWIQE